MKLIFRIGIIAVCIGSLSGCSVFGKYSVDSFELNDETLLEGTIIRHEIVVGDAHVEVGFLDTGDGPYLSGSFGSQMTNSDYLVDGEQKDGIMKVSGVFAGSDNPLFLEERENELVYNLAPNYPTSLLINQDSGSLSLEVGGGLQNVEVASGGDVVMNSLVESSLIEDLRITKSHSSSIELGGVFPSLQSIEVDTEWNNKFLFTGEYTELSDVFLSSETGEIEVVFSGLYSKNIRLFITSVSGDVIVRLPSNLRLIATPSTISGDLFAKNFTREEDVYKNDIAREGEEGILSIEVFIQTDSGNISLETI